MAQQTAVRIDQRPYRISHGTQPRGTGSWAFTFTKGAPTPLDAVFNDDLFWANGTYSEACRAAKVDALAAGEQPGPITTWEA